MTFLKAALNAQRKGRGEEELTTPDFMRRVKAGAEKLGIPQDMLKRGLNVGFSGGEKKRMEILQMALLEPSLGILDETDSGLDIDALKIVSEGVNALRSAKRSFLVITHYQRLLDHIVPDIVHVLAKGRIVKTGGKQFKAAKDDVLIVEKIEGEPGAKVELTEVLMLGDGGKVTVGSPFIKGAKVQAEIVRQGKAPKINAFNYKPKKNERKRWGHRQPQTHLRITGIEAGK